MYHFKMYTNRCKVTILIQLCNVTSVASLSSIYGFSLFVSIFVT